MNTSIKNSVIYNVYPTSFYDSNGDGIGDLKGITEKLEYIRQFADLVWINPVYQSPFRDGGYDISDYLAIDKKFGTMEDVAELAEKAHSLGLRVLFDLVVGHTSDQHPWFIASQKAERNVYSDYYIWNDGVFERCPYKHISGSSERNGDYLINFFSFQPALNFGFSQRKYSWQNHYTDDACLQVHREVVNICKRYLSLGIDGFRVDLASSIVKDDVEGKCSCEVWRKIFGAVREEYPGAIFVSEWGQPQYAVPNGDFDVDFLTHSYNDGYNRLFRKESGANVIRSDGHSFFRREGSGEAATFFTYFLANLEKVRGKGYISVPTGNHDLPRIAMGRTMDEIKTAFAFILALPCVPLIYYGDEIGMPYSYIGNKDGGYNRTGSRTPMQWSAQRNAGFSDSTEELYLPVHESYTTVNVAAQEKDKDSLLSAVREMVRQKKIHEDAFSCDSAFELVSDTYPLVFERKGAHETLLCMVNPSDRVFTVKHSVKAVLSCGNAEIQDDTVTLKPVSYLWALV